MIEEVKKQVEEKINNILEQGIQSDNLEVLGELVDIHKDMANEEYWNKKREVMNMNYREYNEDSYGRGRRRDSRGRYMERNRGRGMYQGHEPMEEMYDRYQEYSEGKERYGHDHSTMKSLDYMLQSVVDFIEMLKEDAGSQQEIELIKKYTREISEM